MRRIVFFLLDIVLLGLVIARILLPDPEVSTAVETISLTASGYNILDLDLPVTTETAGSALVAEMNDYYLSRTPSEKNAYTGLLAGMDLILICADSWAPADPTDQRSSPGLYQLWQDGVRVSEMYRPDWYQGMDGHEFALLTGIVPTNVNGQTALDWTGAQDIYIPFTLARCLSSTGYTCAAYSSDGTTAATYRSLGFAIVGGYAGSALETLKQTLPIYTAEDTGPFFLYYVWTGNEGEEALSFLLSALEDASLLEDTVICLLTGNKEDYRAQLFLWAGDLLSGTRVDTPCSELDVTPTLLDLFGVTYDSRFLSGRDLFAASGQAGEVSDTMPLVSLYGSAYSDWISDAGDLDVANSLFFPTSDCFEDTDAMTAYVQAVSDLVYDRYVYARRVMENNYFELVFGQ